MNPHLAANGCEGVWLTDMHVDYPHWPGTLYDCPACEHLMTEEDEDADENRDGADDQD